MADATLALRIVLNDGASSGLNALGLSFMNLGRIISDIALIQAMNLTDAQKGLGVAAIVTGAAFEALASFVGDTVKAAADLETEMNKVILTVNGAADAGDTLQTSLVHIADTSIYTTAQVADAFSQLGIDGWNATQIMGGLGQTTIDFAEAAQTQTVPAALLLGSAMKMFGASASDATRYADDLTFAMYNGQKSASNLQQAISQVGPIASLAGVNFDELAVALAFMGEQGFMGSRAGTALRYMISGLTSPTKQAAEEMKKLGLAVLDSQNNIISSKFFDDQGNFLGVSNAIDILHKALQNLNPEQQMIALKNLFSVRGGQGAELFLKNYSTWIKDAGNLKNIEAATSVTDKASRVTNTFNGAVTRVKTTWNDFMAMLGQADLGPLKGIFNTIATALDRFNTASPQLHTTVTVILLAVTAAVGLTAAVTGVIFVVTILGSALTAAAPIVGVIAGVMALVAAAAGAITWGIGQATDKTSQFYEIAHPIWQAIQWVFQTVRDEITKELLPALNKMGVNLDTLKVVGVILLAAFVAPIIIALGVLIGLILVVVTVVTKVIQAIVWWEGVMNGASKAIAGFILNIQHNIVNTVLNLINFMRTSGANLIGMFISGFESRVGELMGKINDVAQKIKNVLGFHSPPREGPLADSDSYMPNMMRMYAKGITDHAHLITSATRSVAQGLVPGGGAMFLPNAATAGAGFAGGGVGSSGGNIVVNNVIDGKVVSQVTLDRLTGTLKQNGAGRLFR